MGKINLKSPEKFVIKISNCGTDSFRVNYEKMESEDALELATRVIAIMCNDFINNEQSPLFQYHLACTLLKGLEGIDKDKLWTDIEQADKLKNKWTLTIKEQKKNYS